MAEPLFERRGTVKIVSFSVRIAKIATSDVRIFTCSIAYPLNILERLMLTPRDGQPDEGLFS
jgi:hypothetical protein